MKSANQGYTLVELIVAVGLFALIMLLASGAYLFMISINKQAQTLASGIDNLSFALESMTRDIRTGSAYTSNGTYCGTSLTFTNQVGDTILYDLDLSSGVLRKTTDSGPAVPLTDGSVKVTNLYFCVSGRQPLSGDTIQANALIFITGNVSWGPNKTSQFSVETGATMRGTDL